MYEMEKDNYEPINQTDIEIDVVLDAQQNSSQPVKQSPIAKVLPNSQKHPTSKSKSLIRRSSKET